MVWNGCDKNETNINLLDLANQPGKSDEERKSSEQPKQDAVQRINLLDRIFDYLDVGSLCSFAETSAHSKQLVESHIKTHAEQNGTFTITVEFKSFENAGDLHHMFAPYVTDLKIYALHPGFLW